MIDDILSAIKSELAALYPSCVVYDYYHAQDFKTPSFLISIIDHGYGKRLKNTRKGKLSLDLQYFSGAKSVDIKAIRADCFAVQQVLLREIDLIGASFRALNKDARITDNVLHFTFDINYSELVTSTGTPMEKISISVKE
jgi:hypothetical protein